MALLARVRVRLTGPGLDDRLVIGSPTARSRSDFDVAAAITRNTSDLYRYLAEHVGPLPGVQYVETAPALRQVKRLG